MGQATLGDVADVVSGVGFPKDIQGNAGGEIPVFKVGDISIAVKSGTRYLRTSPNHLSKEEARRLTANLMPAGTIVFAKIGEGLKLNRRAVLAQPSLVDNNVMGLIPKGNSVTSSYLYYFMQTVDLGTLSRATAVPSVRKSDVVELSIPLPSLSLQNEIVAEIEKQFSRLDEAVANLQRVKANLKRYKASVLKDAVEGRLVPTEAELARREGRSFETGEQLLQRILETRRGQWKGKGKLKAAVSPEIDELHELPDGWTWCATDQVCEKITDGEHISPGIVSDGIPLLSAKDVLDAGVTFDDAKYVTASDAEKFRSRCDPDRGDILIVSRGATIGRACRVNTDRVFSLMGSVILMKPSKLVEAGYLMLALKAGFFLTRLTAVSGSTAQQAIYIRDVRPLQLPLPPIAEQQRIAVEVDRLFSHIFSVEAEVNRNLARAVQLRYAVLKQSFVR